MLSSKLKKLAFEKHLPKDQTFVKKPPFVILHGLFGSKQNWRSLGKSFASRLQTPVYTLDLLNHGESPWTNGAVPHPEKNSLSKSKLIPEYQELCESVEGFISDNIGPGNPVWLMGHSLGGKVAMLVDLRSKNTNSQESINIDKLISVDMPPRRHSLNSTKLYVYLKAMDEIKSHQPPIHTRKDADYLLSLAESNIHIRQFLMTNWSKDSKEELGWKWRINVEGLRNRLHGFGWWIEKDDLREKSLTDFLLIYGKNSDYVKPLYDEKICKSYFPNSKLLGLETGHWVHSELPMQFTDSVCNFLK